MKVSELIRYIKKQGVKYQSHGKRHDIYINPKTGGRSEIPRHPAKELSTGTADGILKTWG